MLGNLLSAGRKAWLGSIKHGVSGARKGAAWAKGVGKSAPAWAKGHPTAMMAGAGGAAGLYGYASGEGTTGQRLERGLGFATVIGLGMSPKFRGAVRKQYRTADRAIGMYGFKKGLGAVGSRFISGSAGTARMAAVGGLYGALDSDTTILGGMAAGAGLGVLGKGAARGWGKGHRIGMRTGAAAGGAVGMYTGGPVGMAVGAGIGGAAGGAIRLARKYPKTAKATAFTGLVGGMSTMIVGGAAVNAYDMHQGPKQTNYGADGDLALGLHSLRHG